MAGNETDRDPDGAPTADPLISVIVPAYRHAAYIEEALRSVHAQTHPAVELIVIDDCSDDDTFAVAEALVQGDFAARFQRVQLLRNERNLGAHATINKGVAASRGRYVAVLNSDDAFHPERLAEVTAAMASAGSMLGFSLVEILADPTDLHEIEPFFRLFGPRQLMALARDPSVGFALMRLNIAISTGNLVFERRLFDLAGPFQPMRYCHDWDFILQALWWTEPVAVKRELYRYRLHGGNSFSELTHIAPVEIEAVQRRFFRRGLSGTSPNRLFPNARNWPGLFELYVRQCGLSGFLEAETAPDPGA